MAVACVAALSIFVMDPGPAKVQQAKQALVTTEKLQLKFPEFVKSRLEDIIASDSKEVTGAAA